MTVTACLLAALLAGSEATDRPTVAVVVGADGAAEYGREFEQWAGHWQAAAEKGARFVCIGRAAVADVSDRQQLQQLLDAERKSADSALWLVFIGHGTFDGRVARFNLRGRDVSATELATWLEGFDRPLAIINCASSSGPFVNRLSVDGRVVVTATKTGHEQNYARFGRFLSEAVGDTAADLDKDGQTSLLEAFLTAGRRTTDFYHLEGRLATEHALLDDNGDGLGTRGDWFRGIRPVKRPAGAKSVDGFRAHQFHLIRSSRERRLSSQLRRQRDKIELTVITLRDRKAELAEDKYYAQLEALLLELAEIYEQTDSDNARTDSE